MPICVQNLRKNSANYLFSVEEAFNFLYENYAKFNLKITYCDYNNSDRRCYRIKANAYFVISTINKMYLKDFNLNARK